MYPEKRAVTKLDGLIEHAVKAEKDRDLNDHRKAAAERIDAILFVELHRLLIHPLRIIFVLLPELVHDRRKLGHLSHRLGRRILQRPEQRPDDDRHDDDGERIAFHPRVERVHHRQQQFADPFRPAEIHDVGLIVREFCQASELFWPGVNVESDGLGLSGLQTEAWNFDGTLDGFDRWLGHPRSEYSPAWPRPADHRCLLRSQNCREILVAYRCPEDFVGGGGVNILRSTGLKHPEQFAGIKVIDGDGVEFAVSVPVKLSRVDPVGSVDRLRRTRADKKAGRIERGRAIVLESNREVDLVIVF